VVVNLVCYFGQFSEDDCTHSCPLDLKTTRDFLCLEEVVFHSAAGFQRDMINHGEAIVFNVGGGSSISRGRKRCFVQKKYVVEGSSVVGTVVGASGIFIGIFRVAVRWGLLSEMFSVAFSALPFGIGLLAVSWPPCWV